ncbi:MAG: hypothetical protein ABSB86_10675 [Bryobacteraceae bacterium]
MRHRLAGLRSALAIAIAAGLLAPTLVRGQAWTPARTPDGQPDLQGFWSNVSITPLERPAELAGKEYFTDRELAEVEKQAEKPKGVEVLGGTIAHYDFLQFGLDQTQAKHALNHRTSLIVDPPDGKTPPLTAEAVKRAAARAEARKHSGAGPYDGPENRPLSERCIFMTEGPPMLPEAYNSNLQFQQGPGYVAILQEEIHDVRIIPLDGRPHVGPNIHEYMGDSRGRWEGNTLVVDTTNFTDKTRFMGSTESLHVVERFTMLDADTILYRFTVDDPATWVRPWTAELPMTRIQGPLYEFACHEGNYGLANTLSAARAEEAKQAGK